MKFRGFLKKGIKKQFEKDVTISDPGSDDSWDLLWKNQEGSQTNVPAETQLNKIPSSSAAASSASTPIIVSQEQKNTAIRNASPVPQPVVTNTNAELKENFELNKEKKKVFPLTSTPFVRSKRVPTFDVSSIISPIDVCSNEGFSEVLLPNDSGATLVVNRNNPERPADETFNQLLNLGKKPALPTSGLLSGVKPLKTVINQADTTRQYAGRAVKRRGVCSVNVSQNAVESSWETVTDTCEKKSSSSSSMAQGRSQGVSQSSAKTEEVKGRSVIKTNRKSEKRTSIQFENSIPAEANSPCESTVIGQRISCLDAASDPQMNDNKGSPTKGSCAPVKQSSEKSGKTLVCKSLKHQVQDGSKTAIENDHSNGIEEMRGQSRVDILSATNVHLVREKNFTPQETSTNAPRIDRLPECEKKSYESVRFVEPATTSSAITNNVRSSNVMENGEEVAPIQEPIDHQDDKVNDGKSEAKESGKAMLETEETSNESQDEVADADLQLQSQTAGPVGIANKESTECPSLHMLKHRASGNADKILCHQSEFLVKIGSHTIKQSSCFGFSLKCEQHMRSEKNKIEPTHNEHKQFEGREVSTVKETDATGIHSKETIVASNQAGDSNVDSSSEEERNLLRAQSKKMKESHSRLSKSSRCTKILGLNSQQLSRGNKVDVSEVTKSPIKSSINLNLPRVHEQRKEINPAVSSTLPHIVDCQPTQPQKNNELVDPHDVSQSSCDLVLMSRNPTDCPKHSYDFLETCDDDLQLVIMSSSEEEEHISKNHQSQESQFTTETNKGFDSKHPRKGLNLSRRSKEIRRRREEKIEETLKNSSESDSQPHSPLVDEKKSGYDEPAEPDLSQETKESETVKEEEEEKEAVNVPQKKSNILSKQNEKIVSQKNGEDLAGRNQGIVSQKEENRKRIKNDHHPFLGKKRADLPLQQDDMDVPLKKRNILNKQNERIVSQKKRKDLAIQNQGTISHKEENRKRLKNTHHPSLGKKKADLPLQDDMDNLKANENQNHLANLMIDNEANVEGHPRCSRRNRRPPSMYWLGLRTQHDAPSDSSQKVGEESSTPAYTEATYHNKNMNQPKRLKRKIEKASRSGTLENLKRVRQAEQELNASQNEDSQPRSNEEVLVYDAGNAITHEGECLTCERREVKFTELVWGFGVEGNMLSLGVGAKCDYQKSRMFSQVFYVLEGEIRYQFAQEDRILKSGSAFIVPKGEECHIKNFGNSTGKLFVTNCVS